MSKYNKGDTVRLVRCADKYMQADRRNLGKSGVIVDVIRDGSLVYFGVELDNRRVEHCEAQALSMQRRATRSTDKRSEVPYA